MCPCSSLGHCSIPVGKGNEEEKPVLLPGEHSLRCPGEAHGDQPSLGISSGSGSSKLSICIPVTATSGLFMARELNISSHLREGLEIHMHVMRGEQ